MATHHSISANHYHAGESANPAWIEWMARVGYVAKGVVYAMVGLIAFKAAFSTGSSTGSEGAIREIGQQPFGQWLLTLTAIGLLAYTAWRIIQGVKDTENRGNDAKGLAMRAAYVISGLSYLALAALAASIAWGWGMGGSGSQGWTAELMAQPFGQWLVAIVGLIVIGIGIRQFIRAYTASFMKSYDMTEMSPGQETWARRLGRFGISSRGVTFSIIGTFIIVAAVQAAPQEASGLGGALQTLGQQAYGPWLLGLIALGFIAYGIYCFSRAAFRSFHI